MKSENVDYTTMRKGTKVSKYRIIDYCPKCGRKGSLLKPGVDKTGKPYKGNVIHTGAVVDIGGFIAFEIHESCYLD